MLGADAVDFRLVGFRNITQQNGLLHDEARVGDEAMEQPSQCRFPSEFSRVMHAAILNRKTLEALAVPLWVPTHVIVMSGDFTWMCLVFRQTHRLHGHKLPFALLRLV